MSDFNYQPAYGAQFSKTPRILVAQFSDGYDQSIADGINNQLGQWTLTFSAAKNDVDAIESFLDGKGGTTAFTWTPEGRSEVLVKCRGWSYSYNSHNTRLLNCTFQEVAA